ncbi:MAG: hypothetical protein F6K44_29020 [Moorea sp. SIO3E2]|nr:hypothetical protein [Moorena sp. SIO3E2]
MGETPKTALAPQDRNGALSVGELNSPRVAPLHRSNALQINVVSILNKTVPSSNKYRQA